MTIKHSPPLVLIADDQVPTTVMLEHLFKNDGYQVKSVYDGNEAFEFAQRQLPDLILLDINMPGLNGLEVLRALREQPSTANIPTILITARSEPTDVAQGLSLGADDYLPKPFHPRELLARARTKMRARQLEEALQRRTQDLEALLRVSEELNQHLEIEELMHLILYLALDLLPANLAFICRFDEHRKIIDAQWQQKLDLEERREMDTDKIVAQIDHALHNGNGLTLLWPDDLPSLVPGFEYGMLTVLRHSTDIHGVLVLGAHEPFDANHFRLFAGIGTQATLAIRNAEFYELQANYAMHLEDMVSARTAELQSAQQLLIQAEKMASVGRLAASIAHEINNPLLPIRINLEHMVEDIQSGLAIDIEEVERTQESVERISRIVSRLLQFSRKPSSDNPDVELLNLSDILQDIIGLNQKYFEQHSMSIETHFEALPPVHGSRDQLEQVFMNMVLNARAAMSEGGKLIIRGAVAGREIKIEFIDNGSGIAPDLIDTIFEPFVSTKEDGTGLGLFISYGIIQNHRGRIEVMSEVSKGTTFTVYLPAASILT